MTSEVEKTVLDELQLSDRHEICLEDDEEAPADSEALDPQAAVALKPTFPSKGRSQVPLRRIAFHASARSSTSAVKVLVSTRKISVRVVGIRAQMYGAVLSFTQESPYHPMQMQKTLIWTGSNIQEKTPRRAHLCLV